MRVKLLFVLVLLSLVSISGQTIARKAAPAMPGAPDETTITVLQPDIMDADRAAKQGFNIFKLLPRGTHDYENNAYGLRGGGAYYSFATKSHSYNKTAQIQLDRGELSTGFAGADYGFIRDLEDVDLASVDAKLPAVKFLSEYKPPIYEREVRDEKKKSHNYSAEGLNFTRSLPAVAGHTYILRNITFREADTLVAFRVERIAEDGSAIIFWKSIKSFEVPKLLYAPDAEIKAKVDEILKNPKYAEVTAQVIDNKITLKGQVADAEYPNLLRDVTEIQSMGVNNQVMKKR